MTLRHDRSPRTSPPGRGPAVSALGLLALYGCGTWAGVVPRAGLDASAMLAGGYDTNVHRAPPPIAGHDVVGADSPKGGSLFLLEGALRFTGESRTVAGTTGANVTIPMSDEGDGPDGRLLSRDRSEVAIDGALDLPLGPRGALSFGVALARLDHPSDLGAATADPDGARRGHRSPSLAVTADTGLRVGLGGAAGGLESPFTLDLDYAFAASRHDDLAAADEDRHQVGLDTAWHFRRHGSLHLTVTFDAVLRPEAPETAASRALWLDTRLAANSWLGHGFVGGLEVAWTAVDVAPGTVAGRLWFGVDIARFAVLTLDLERRHGPSVWGDSVTRHIAAFHARIDAPALVPWLLAEMSISWSHVAFGPWTTPLTVPIDRYVTHQDRNFELVEFLGEVGLVARPWLDLALRYVYHGRHSAFGVETIADTSSAVTTRFGTDRALSHQALFLLRFRTPRR